MGIFVRENLNEGVKMSQTTLKLEKLTCPSCMQKIIETVNDLDGVLKTRVLFESSKARVHFNQDIVSEENIINKIVEIGYAAEKIK